MRYKTIINGQEFDIEIHADGRLTVNGQPHEIDFLEIVHGRHSLIKDFRSSEVVIEERDGTYQILLDGKLYEGQVLDERALLMANRKGGIKANTGDVVSPMPGLIVEALVSVGDSVQEGQSVVILESMKMQNELKAPRSGRVTTVNASKGQTVDKGAVLVIIGDDES
jgi:biotin carboxyl carrier protein